MLENHEVLALRILKQAKDDYDDGYKANGEGRETLYQKVLARYASGAVIAGDGSDIAAFVATHCVGLRLRCVDCEGLLETLDTDIEVDCNQFKIPIRSYRQDHKATIRLLKCRRCAAVHFTAVIGED